MALLLLRTFLIYFLIIVAMRLMGKKQLGELQPSELVSTILISNLASISIESPELPLLSSIVPVFVIVSLEILLSALCMASRRAEKLLSVNGHYVEENLRRCGVTRDWAAAQCAQEGCRLEDVFLLMCNDVQETSLIKKEAT